MEVLLYSNLYNVCVCVCVCASRKESAKKAYTEAQGLVLFGNKIKLTPVDREGEPFIVYTIYIYMYMYMLVKAHRPKHSMLDCVTAVKTALKETLF